MSHLISHSIILNQHFPKLSNNGHLYSNTHIVFVSKNLDEEHQEELDKKFGKEKDLQNAISKRKIAYQQEIELLKIAKQNYLNKKKYRNNGIYKQRQYTGHSFGTTLETTFLYLLRCYQIAFPSKINPSIDTLANQLNICSSTCKKYLSILKNGGDIDWISGKKERDTNKYLIKIPLDRCIARPKGFHIPRMLWFAMKNKLYIHKKSKDLRHTNNIFKHLSLDFAHDILCIRLFIRALKRKYLKTMNSDTDDPKNNGVFAKKEQKPYKKLVSLPILNQFKMSQQDCCLLSKFGEYVLRMAIDDYNWYIGHMTIEEQFELGKLDVPDGVYLPNISYKEMQNINNKKLAIKKRQVNRVKNIPAFLTSRCKVHLEKIRSKKNEKDKKHVEDIRREEESLPLVYRIKKYLTDMKDNFIFTNYLKNINDRHRYERKIFISAYLDGENKYVDVLQRINNDWIKKKIYLSRPNCYQFLKEYLDMCIKKNLR